MKFLKYFFIFILFLTVGTYVATLFSPQHHSSTHEENIKNEVSTVWNFLIDTANVTKWMQNSVKIHPSTEKSEKGKAYEVVFEDIEGNVQKVVQVWDIDSNSHGIRITSIIPNKVSMIQTLSLEKKDATYTTVKSNIEIEVHGWLNRLLLTGVSASLLEREKQEIQSIISHTGG